MVEATEHHLGETLHWWVNCSAVRGPAHAFGGSGLFSLAALIALMLFVADSSNGAPTSHSSTLFGCNRDECLCLIPLWWGTGRGHLQD